MKDYAVKKFLRVYGKSFPLKKKFNFTGFCVDVKSLIDDEYDYLLMRNEQYHLNKKRKDEIKRKISLDLKNLENDKTLYFENKRKSLLKKQKLMLSSYNNKMLLDLMFKNKKYVKYITEKNIENIKTRNNKKNKFFEKLDDSINNNNLTEANKTKDIFSSLNSLETINEFNPKKSNYLNQRNNMNKTFSKFVPNKINSLFKQNNPFFKTSIPNKQIKYSPSIRNSLFTIHSKSTKNKYNINHTQKFPNLSRKYIDFNSNVINTSNEIEKEKNSEITKNNINYDRTLRKKIIFNNIQPNKKPDIDINKNKKYSVKLTIVPKKKNLFLSNSNAIKFIKSNIFKEELNPIKTIYKTKINI